VISGIAAAKNLKSIPIPIERKKSTDQKNMYASNVFCIFVMKYTRTDIKVVVMSENGS
jgi:hypothetical protein